MANLNRIDELCKKAKLIGKIYYGNCASSLILDKIAHDLNVVLPDDFVDISDEVPYESFTICGEPFSLSEDYAIMKEKEIKIANIIDYNLEYRKRYKNLEKIVVLSEESDVSFLLMFTQDSPEQPTPIVWCDYEDLYNYSETGEFKYKIDKWDSFTDFFEYLVEQEEKVQEEEKNQPEPIKTVLHEKKSFWKKLFCK